MDETEKTEKNERKSVLFIDTSDGRSLDDDPDLKAAIMSLGRDLGMEIVEGPIVPCKTCGYYACVCDARKHHGEKCHYRRAMETKIGIPCDLHGLDVCPECDKCDCSSSAVKQCFWSW